MIKGGEKKSNNRLTRHQVGRVTGSTDGWPILSQFLALSGFSGYTGQAGPILTTLQKSLYEGYIFLKLILHTVWEHTFGRVFQNTVKFHIVPLGNLSYNLFILHIY